MSATNADIAAARLVHELALQYNRLDSLGPAEARVRALAAARGREHASEAAFVESVQRGEAELLALPQVERQRESLVALGLSESEARRQALDDAWEIFTEVERRDRDTRDAGRVLANLSEADRRVHDAATNALRVIYGDTPAPDAGWDGRQIVDESKASVLLEERRRALGGYPAARGPLGPAEKDHRRRNR